MLKADRYPVSEADANEIDDVVVGPKPESGSRALLDEDKAGRKHATAGLQTLAAQQRRNPNDGRQVPVDLRAGEERAPTATGGAAYDPGCLERTESLADAGPADSEPLCQFALTAEATAGRDLTAGDEVENAPAYDFRDRSQRSRLVQLSVLTWCPQPPLSQAGPGLRRRQEVGR